jgi:hypothetical protein
MSIDFGFIGSFKGGRAKAPDYAITQKKKHG